MTASMWNKTLDWNTAIHHHFFLNDYFLKYAQHMVDVFSTGNISMHHRINIGIKDQYDLYKSL